MAEVGARRGDVSFPKGRGAATYDRLRRPPCTLGREGRPAACSRRPRDGTPGAPCRGRANWAFRTRTVPQLLPLAARSARASPNPVISFTTASIKPAKSGWDGISPESRERRSRRPVRKAADGAMVASRVRRNSVSSIARSLPSRSASGNRSPSFSASAGQGSGSPASGPTRTHSPALPLAPPGQRAKTRVKRRRAPSAMPTLRACPESGSKMPSRRPALQPSPCCHVEPGPDSRRAVPETVRFGQAAAYAIQPIPQRRHIPRAKSRPRGHPHRARGLGGRQARLESFATGGRMPASGKCNTIGQSVSAQPAQEVNLFASKRVVHARRRRRPCALLHDR